MVGNPRTSYCCANCTFCFFSSTGWDFRRGKSSSTRTRLSCAKFLNCGCDRNFMSNLMHHPHHLDPVKLRNRSLWFAFSYSCAFLDLCCQLDSARAKAAQTSETATATRNKRGVSNHHLRCSSKPVQERRNAPPGAPSVVFSTPRNSPARQRRAIKG